MQAKLYCAGMHAPSLAIQRRGMKGVVQSSEASTHSVALSEADTGLWTFIGAKWLAGRDTDSYSGSVVHESSGMKEEGRLRKRSFPERSEDVLDRDSQGISFRVHGGEGKLLRLLLRHESRQAE